MSQRLKSLLTWSVAGGIAYGVLAKPVHVQAQQVAAKVPAFEQVQSADERRYQALYAGNLNAVAGLLADGLLYTHSSAITDDKASYLASLRKGNIIYHDTLRDTVVMRQHEDTVVMAGHIVIDATIDGTRRKLLNRFTATWVPDRGQWKLLAWASTAIPKE